MEQYEAALNDFNRAIELNPNLAWALAERGETYRLMKQYEAALNDFNRAIELDPKYTWAFNQRNLTYLQMMRFVPAVIGYIKLILIGLSKNKNS